ncbi:MAG TPA: VWA domain-containing protein [Pyrinomonadaceae bacterium]|jgi:Ca-activated chloride channel family protein
MLPAHEFRNILTTLSAIGLRVSAQSAFVLICICMGQVGLRVQAQEPAEEVLRVSTDLFVLPIRVKDQRGPAAAPLTDRDLVLSDADHVTAGLTLYHGADRIALLFALDQSGSLRDIVSEQRETALALARRFGEKSQVAVLRFAEQPSLVVPFGQDLSAARDAFAFPAIANQHTAIFDAAIAAAKAFSALPQIRSERRIVVLISDGLDNASASKASAAIAAALVNHVSFYVIHLPLFQPRDGRLAVRPPAKGFRDLAEKTGGKYFLVGNAASALAPGGYNKNNDLTPIFQAIEDDLRSQYLLGFYLGEGARDGRNHRFTIGFPAGVEYQVAYAKFKRTHEFSQQDLPQAKP